MRDWLKASLLGTGVFGASWTGAIAYWRAGNRMPSTLDLVGWMLVLPLSLLFALWLGRRVLAARSAAAAAASAPAAAGAAQSSAVPAPGLPELAILDAAIRTPHGDAPAELADAIGAQRARAGLDPELVDDAGFPLLSARVEDAIDDEFKQEVDNWRIGAALDDPHWTPEQWRALALGTAAASELLLQAIGHPQLAAADEGGASLPPPPVLRIHAAPASAWNDIQRTATAAWLASLAVRAGWPQERVQAVVQPAPASTLLSELAAQARTEPVLAIVLAFGSELGEASIERMAQDGKLFSADNPQGLIPGEAAAGLLVGGTDQAALFDPAAPRLQLTSAPRGAQESNGRKPDTTQLRQLAGALLPDADDAAAVQALFADTTHRSASLMELMKFAGEVLPGLDAGQDLKATGGACGHCGEAPFLVALALAHQHALATAGAAFCVGHEHPLQRTAALVRPAAAQS